MGGTAVLRGPPPPADAALGFCLVCASVGKFLALERIRADVTEHEARGHGVRHFPLPVPGEFLQRAVAWSVIQAMGAAGPVCWSHVTAVAPQSSGIIPAGPLPPGFGNGGVPLLGQ